MSQMNQEVRREEEKEKMYSNQDLTVMLEYSHKLANVHITPVALGTEDNDWSINYPRENVYGRTDETKQYDFNFIRVTEEEKFMRYKLAFYVREEHPDEENPEDRFSYRTIKTAYYPVSQVILTMTERG